LSEVGQSRKLGEMKNLFLQNIKEIIEKAIIEAGFEIKSIDIHIEKTKNPEHGHFATNTALLIAGKYGIKPRDAAEKIEKYIKADVIEKTAIAGPGFINMWLKTEYYSNICKDMLDDIDSYLKGVIQLEEKQTMMLDYSSPNVAKPLGVHHLLSTIIGDGIKHIYKKVGYNVISDNYLGDMGTQFGKLIFAIKKWGDEKEIAKDPINTLLNLYVLFHNEAEKDSSIEDEARGEFKKFEDGDEINRKWWRKIVDWSLLELKPLYERLDIEFDYMHGESFYEDKMGEILKKGREDKVFVDGNNGAWIVMPNDPNDSPAIVRKSDGSTIYLTRDLAQTKYWEDTFKPDLMVWVVDVAQSLHFRQRFDASKKLNQTSAPMVHVNFGRMQFKDGAMSTRKGNMVRLDDLLDEAEKRAHNTIDDKGIDLSEHEKKELSRIMGIGSVKYNILSQNRTTNITFDWDRMLSFEGNSAPYLMYTFARAKSIIRKSEVNLGSIESFKLVDLGDCEMEILTDVLMYPDVLVRAMEEFKPNHIANYLYHLAQSFNTFYNAEQILKTEDKLLKSRLKIVATVMTIIEDGLSLLGLEVPEKM